MKNLASRTNGPEVNDPMLKAELAAAGIPWESHEILVDGSGEVKSSIIGLLHGWTFKRAWYYWMCSGPGIDVETAERLHAQFGQVVRVSGHCGCPSPRQWYKGLACGSYHVDSQEGLKALADTIKELVARSEPLLKIDAETNERETQRTKVLLAVRKFLSDGNPGETASQLLLHVKGALGEKP